VSAEEVLELRVHADDADDAALDQLARQLRGQLLDLDVDAVEALPSGEGADDSKALDLVVVGGLLVRFGPGVAAAVVNAVRAWVGRDGKRSVTMKIGEHEITLQAATAEQQEKLVEAWLADVHG
jgi:hypothetical protein